MQEIEENDYQIQKNVNVKRVLNASYNVKVKEDLDSLQPSSHEEIQPSDLISKKYNSYQKLQFYSNHVKEYFYFYELLSSSNSPIFNEKHFILLVSDWIKKENPLSTFEKVAESNKKKRITKLSPSCKSTDNQNSYCSQGFLS